MKILDKKGLMREFEDLAELEMSIKYDRSPDGPILSEDEIKELQRIDKRIKQIAAILEWPLDEDS